MPFVVPANSNGPPRQDPGNEPDDSSFLMAAATIHANRQAAAREDPVGRAAWQAGQRTVLPGPGGRGYREAEEEPVRPDKAFVEAYKQKAELAPKGFGTEGRRKSEEVEDVRQPAEPLLGNLPDAAAKAYLAGSISEKDFMAAYPQAAGMSKSELAKALGIRDIDQALQEDIQTGITERVLKEFAKKEKAPVPLPRRRPR